MTYETKKALRARLEDNNASLNKLLDARDAELNILGTKLDRVTKERSKAEALLKSEGYVLYPTIFGVQYRPGRNRADERSSLLATISRALGYPGTPEQFWADIQRLVGLNTEADQAAKDQEAVERITGLDFGYGKNGAAS